jgi:hypothetical protein
MFFDASPIDSTQHYRHQLDRSAADHQHDHAAAHGSPFPP